MLLLLGTTLPSAFAQWVAMPDGPNEHVRVLCYDSVNDRLYAFGRFLQAGGQVVNGTTYLEDGQWHPMGEGVENVFALSVMDAHVNNDSVMISGAFNALVGVPNTKRIALWNGTEWKSIGGIGGNGNAAGMLANEDGWTMAGGFTEIGGIPSHGIARYHNGAWEDLCAYPDNSGYKVYTAAAQYQDQYIFGGNINGDFPDLNEIGVLDNDSLRAMGAGILGDSWVNDMVVYNGKLFVAGEFYAGWGNPGSAIMTWNGSNWDDPIPGVFYTSQMYDLDMYDGYLFLSGQVRIASDPQDFYMLARYDGEQLCLFGKNINAAVSAIAGSPEGLYVSFNVPNLIIDGLDLGYLSRYDISQGFDTCIALPTGLSSHNMNDPSLMIHPNPSNGTFEINLPATVDARTVAVHDVLGNLVPYDRLPYRQAVHGLAIRLDDASPGMYMVRICTGDGHCLTGRVIVD